MINSYSDLVNCLKIEKSFYFQDYSSLKRRIFFRFTNQHMYLIWRYVKMLRWCEYLLNTGGGNPLKVLLFWILERRRNGLGNKIGICITTNVFDDGLFIDHIGSIIINANARIGKGCHIHGDCCIGNTGFSHEVPVLGNNVNIGWGAIIRGNVIVADGVKIGANAVVTKSILKANSVVVGVPAKEVV